MTPKDRKSMTDILTITQNKGGWRKKRLTPLLK
jgi:hypothetical protein